MFGFIKLKKNKFTVVQKNTVHLKLQNICTHRATAFPQQKFP